MNGFNIELNGLNYHVIDQGEGVPVLLLHGFPDSSKLWTHMISLLNAEGYRVIAPDLRGYGKTQLAEDYTIQQSAKDLFDLLNALQIHNIKVVGHDWGSILGWYFAAHYPTVVESYVALSVGHPKAYFRRGTLKQLFKGSYVGLFLQRGIAEKVLSAGNYFVLRKMAGESEELEQQWLEDLPRPGRLTAGLNWYRANFNISNIGWIKNMPNVSVPVLGIIGAKDPALTIAQMQHSLYYVNGTFVSEVFDEEGHWMPMTCPHQLVTRLVEFYR